MDRDRDMDLRRAAPLPQRPRVGVVGGSLIGLTAALVLRDIGCHVDVYERSSVPLEGRGVGIVLHPSTVRYLLVNKRLDLGRASTSASTHRYVSPDGGVVSEHRRKHHFAGYGTIYRALLNAFGAEHYHLGHELRDLRQDGERVVLSFANGRQENCDLLIAADGVSSLVRRRLVPGIEARYAGYVAWRGVVDERDLTDESFAALTDALTYCLMPHTHALTYPIPSHDGDVEPGRRLMNLVWYRNVPAGLALDQLMTDRSGSRRLVSLPPGSVQDRHLDNLQRAARVQLPPAFAEVVAKTPTPFLQVILDVEVPRMAFGRIALVGDAAFTVRPHAAAATAKGADDVWALREALVRCGGDVEAALAGWEPAQLELGRALLARNRALGDGMQFRNQWSPGDASLTFGLYEPGDSSQLRIA